MEIKSKPGDRGKAGFLRFFRPSMRFYFAVLVVFCIAAFLMRYWLLGSLEAILTILLFVYTRLHRSNQKKKLLEYVGSSTEQLQDGATNTILSMPLPMVIFHLKDGEVLWSNEEFLRIVGDREHIFEVNLSDLMPGFDLKWLAEGLSQAEAPVQIRNHRFRVYGNVIRMDHSRADDAYWGMCYFVDVTAYEHISSEYALSRPVTAVIMLDNYEELFKNVNESEKSALLSNLDKRISDWCAPASGYLCRYDRDRYIFIFEERYLKSFRDGRFSLLDSVRELQSSNGIAATVSIGVGCGAETLAQSDQFAMQAIEKSISRGGDQAVIKTPTDFDFIGGSNQAQEKSSKVKSRVVSYRLGDLIRDSSNVIIMGHKQADLDCVGAAVGICCIARKLGKPAYIILNREKNMAGLLLSRMSEIPEYTDTFISEAEGLLHADERSLLVIVDTNRPDQVESDDLLKNSRKIAIVDHHRSAADGITGAVLNFTEPFASSASEQVTELMLYHVEQRDVQKREAEAILAGIALDTKNFTVRSGTRTFEAAAFLRRCGADPTEVKKMMQNDLDESKRKFAIIQSAKEFRPGIVIAVCGDMDNRVTAGQAADELVNISGIETSFVIYGGEDTVNISARSIGPVSAQIVMEKMGGGGNKTQAGAQIRDKSAEEVCAELEQVIIEYLNNNEDRTEGLK